MGELRAKQVFLDNAPTDPSHAVTKAYADNTSGGAAAKYVFKVYDGLGQSITEQAMFDRDGTFSSIHIIGDGNLIGAQLRVTSPRTAGSLTLKYRLTRGVNPPTIITTTGPSLDLVIDGTNTEYIKAVVDDSNTDYALQEDDILEAVLTTDASWAPVTATIEATLWVIA